MALHDTCIIDQMAKASSAVGGSVATGLLGISPDFFSRKPEKKQIKKTKFKPLNTSEIDA